MQVVERRRRADGADAGAGGGPSKVWGLPSPETRQSPPNFWVYAFRGVGRAGHRRRTGHSGHWTPADLRRLPSARDPTTGSGGVVAGLRLNAQKEGLVGSRGVPPKDPSKRQRRNKPPELEELPASHDGEVPPLPRRSSYLKATRDWYDGWATSPQASGFGGTDWTRLHMLAALVDAYWREPRASLMSEIRLNEAKLDATIEDRQRLRWKLPGPEQEAEEPPKPARPKRRRSPSPRDPRLRSV